LISVYITSFNKSIFISEAIESVLSQTLKPYELIIIDDASTDNSREIIDGYKNRYPDIIKVLYNEKNLGISRTRNKALEICSGDFVTFLDADDYFYPQKLEFESNLLKNKNVDVVYSNFNYVNENNKVLGRFSSDGDTPAQGNIFRQTISKKYDVSSGNNYIYEMFYKACINEVGNYDEKIKIWEDWDLRIRMSKIFNYAYCSKINSVYRKLDKGLHKSSYRMHYKEKLKIIKKNRHLLNDLSLKHKRDVNNRIYAKIKVYFIGYLKQLVRKKYYISFTINLFEFFINFRQKKIFSFVYEELRKSK
tara:strand:- start:1752 stop:2669 length:918 start_codon:yes stop_codon:yes gene_type:complete